jgi:excinuclease ABC subunit A
VIATGTPEQVARVADSHTGHFLAQTLPADQADATPGARRRKPRRATASAAR